MLLIFPLPSSSLFKFINCNYSDREFAAHAVWQKLTSAHAEGGMGDAFRKIEALLNHTSESHSAVSKSTWWSLSSWPVYRTDATWTQARFACCTTSNYPSWKVSYSLRCDKCSCIISSPPFFRARSLILSDLICRNEKFFHCHGTEREHKTK